MKSLIELVVLAIASGIQQPITEVAGQAVKDSYAGLKIVINNWYGKWGTKKLESVEQRVNEAPDLMNTDSMKQIANELSQDDQIKQLLEQIEKDADSKDAETAENIVALQNAIADLEEAVKQASNSELDISPSSDFYKVIKNTPIGELIEIDDVGEVSFKGSVAPSPKGIKRAVKIKKAGKVDFEGEQNSPK